jgi:hypothetical protein
MTDTKTHSGMRTLAVTAAIAAIVFFGNSIGTLQAQPAATGTGAPPPDVTPNLCEVEMRPYAQVEIGRFRDFIRTNFQNKSSTTSLLEIAIGRYRELRTSLYTKYATYYPQQGAMQLSVCLVPGACLDVVESALSMARNELKVRAIQTSSVKQASALITKYQEINAKLAGLYRTFTTMKSYLDTFGSKLPCYIKKSCNKG